jgi:type IV secretory pathway VirB2 component (pilin)
MRACIGHDVGSMRLIRALIRADTSRNMTKELNGRTGFSPPIRPQQSARQRTTLALIATVALAISIAVAATVVSMGMARADMLSGIADSDNGPFALAGFVGLVLAGMGGLIALVTWRQRPSIPNE